MPSIKVKKEFEKTVVGFNNSALPLGKRDDLHVLLNDVIGPNDAVRNDHIRQMFETVPTRKELDELNNIQLEKKADQLKKSTSQVVNETK